MNFSNDLSKFVQEISDKRQEIDEASRDYPSLSVAVLGPGLSDPDAPGPQKRIQIYEALQKDGHKPFFPECRIATGKSDDPALDQERQMLADSKVDLVVILHTEENAGAATSVGVAMEIAKFREIRKIADKTAILCPKKFYIPDQNLVANEVQAYRVKFPYPEEYVELCTLVTICRWWANMRATDRWSTVITTHIF